MRQDNIFNFIDFIAPLVRKTYYVIIKKYNKRIRDTGPTMKRLQIFIIFLASFASLSAYTADNGGKYAIRGAGLIDCQTFLKEQEKQSSAYLMIGGWIDGYITGASQYASETYDATSFESTELFVEIVKNHCRKNSRDRLFSVVNSIIAQRWESRIKKQTPLVGVKLGENSVQIYRETIVRMQERLAEKGFFKLPVTGQFDAETISALASFQKTLKGYKDTGFPDQATLWALFVE